MIDVHLPGEPENPKDRVGVNEKPEDHMEKANSELKYSTLRGRTLMKKRF